MYGEKCSGSSCCKGIHPESERCGAVVRCANGILCARGRYRRTAGGISGSCCCAHSVSSAADVARQITAAGWWSTRQRLVRMACGQEPYVRAHTWTGGRAKVGDVGASAAALTGRPVRSRPTTIPQRSVGRRAGRCPCKSLPYAGWDTMRGKIDVQVGYPCLAAASSKCPNWPSGPRRARERARREHCRSTRSKIGSSEGSCTRIHSRGVTRAEMLQHGLHTPASVAACEALQEECALERPQVTVDQRALPEVICVRLGHVVADEPKGTARGVQ